MTAATGFPPDFIWGTAASSTQCEGAGPASDWIEWERAGRAPASGEGSGFSERYAKDFGILASLGLNHHRLSIEWARVEPSPGERDPSAVEHYKRVIGSAHDAGLEIWACLHHFTLPNWFTKVGGFLGEGNLERHWIPHLELMAETFGDVVYGWQPINEPCAYTMGSYLFGAMPPGEADMQRAREAGRAMNLAWRDAYAALSTTAKPVATIHNLSPVFPADDSDGAKASADLVDAIVFRTWIRAIRDGVVDIPGLEVEEVEGLKGSCDLFGFSYYSSMAVPAGFGMLPYPLGSEPGPLGYHPWPDGIGIVLRRLRDDLPGVPLLVAENGMGTDDDSEREEFLGRSLAVVEEAIADGCDVRGFFHWTSVDNYEWLHGFDVRFGIISAGRQVKPSARVLSEVAARSRAGK